MYWYLNYFDTSLHSTELKQCDTNYLLLLISFPIYRNPPPHFIHPAYFLRDLHHNASIRHISGRIGDIVMQQLVAVPQARHLLDVDDILVANVAAIVVVLERCVAVLVDRHRLMVAAVRRQAGDIDAAAQHRRRQLAAAEKCAQQQAPPAAVRLAGSLVHGWWLGWVGARIDRVRALHSIFTIG